LLPVDAIDLEPSAPRIVSKFGCAWSRNSVASTFAQTVTVVSHRHFSWERVFQCHNHLMRGKLALRDPTIASHSRPQLRHDSLPIMRQPRRDDLPDPLRPYQTDSRFR